MSSVRKLGTVRGLFGVTFVSVFVELCSVADEIDITANTRKPKRVAPRKKNATLCMACPMVGKCRQGTKNADTHGSCDMLAWNCMPWPPLYSFMLCNVHSFFMRLYYWNNKELRMFVTCRLPMQV